jgi:hypothetical protein
MAGAARRPLIIGVQETNLVKSKKKLVGAAALGGIRECLA